MAASFHVEKNNGVGDKMESIEDRLSSGELSSDGDFADEESSDGESNSNATGDNLKKSGMANVISRILSKDTSKSNRALLAKGKTNKEIQDDIARRRQKKGEDGELIPKTESEDHEISTSEQRMKEEKRRLWDKMSRKAAQEMDVSREIKLRRIATQGMVQLFQSVHDHQKTMNEKIASVGSSDRKKDKVMAEFTKKRFLDVLKSKNTQTNSDEVKKEDNSVEAKWKILQDDFMMGAKMKDWDKEDDSDSDDDCKDEPMGDEDYSD